MLDLQKRYRLLDEEFQENNIQNEEKKNIPIKDRLRNQYGNQRNNPNTGKRYRINFGKHDFETLNRLRQAYKHIKKLQQKLSIQIQLL